MYFTSLPDHRRSGFDEQQHFSKFGKHNIVFHATSTDGHCDRHVGCLSFKTVTSGTEWYGIGGRQVAVRPGQFLMLNHDQEYSCHIPGEATKTLSVFFKKEFASVVYADALRKEEGNLDAIEGTQLPEFFQNLFYLNAGLHAELSNLLRSLNDGGFDGRTDEQLIF